MHLHKFLFIWLLVILSSIASPQGVGVNTASPDASAALDVKDPNKGLLIPRVHLLSETDHATIQSPAVSLLVFNTNNGLPCGAGYYFNNGSIVAPSWRKLISNADLAVVFAARSGAISIVVKADSSLVLPFNVEDFDVSGNFTTAASFINPNTFTAPADGIYHFDGAITWQINLNGGSSFTIYTQLRVNGIYNIRVEDEPLENITTHVNANLQLKAGDKVTLVGFHDNSREVTITRCYFSGNLLLRR